MATSQQLAQLMSITCRWCGAGPRERCRVRGRGDRRPESLDGGCHDARWQDALHQPAPIDRTWRTDYLASRPQPVSLAASAPAERPW
jgi:hypothetical protein